MKELKALDHSCLQTGRNPMPKIIWSCHNCGTVLPLWKMKCSNCHRAALSWLHLIAGAALILPGLFLLLKFI